MTLSRVELAARNNAIWCDIMCRAHGTFGEFHKAVWLNRHPVPRFYPNLVTLSKQHHTAAQHGFIRDLVSSGLPGHWAVKDSFSELGLDEQGFQLLFEGSWLWRAPSASLASGHDPGIEWDRLHDGSKLAKWESAWNGDRADNPSIPEPRLFPASLLVDPNIAFIAANHGSEIVAGAIANRTAGVVGLSNIFTPPEDRVFFWARCVSTARDLFPGLPLVGYEGGPELALAEAVGFKKLQALQVWVRQ